eukprot:30899-Pelagococcus_subviridis.AAC.7
MRDETFRRALSYRLASPPPRPALPRPAPLFVVTRACARTSSPAASSPREPFPPRARTRTRTSAPPPPSRREATTTASET